MNRRKVSFVLTFVTGCAIVAAMAFVSGGAPTASADDTYQTLPFNQSWTSVSQFTTDDDWSGVPGIVGYDGADAANTSPGLDPCVITSNPSGSQAVAVGETQPSILTSVAVAQFVPGPGSQVDNPIVGIRGQTAYDTPFLLIHLNTSGQTGINVQYDLIDIDQSGSNAIQAVALQWRVGNTGAFNNVAAGCVADATAGPDLKGMVTPVNVTLPAGAENQAQLQVRIMTYNANSADEWVGIDNISITAGGGAVPTATTGPTPTENPALTNKTYLPIILR